VASSLDALVQRHQTSDGATLTETTDAYKHLKPGECALLWLMRTGEHRRQDFLQHKTLLKSIMHCLVAESSWDVIRSWVFTDNSHSPSLHLERSVQNVWRGRILAHALEAEAYWSSDPLPLDKPLRIYGKPPNAGCS